MKKQREFVADASHELRTPLTSILANLELLQASLSGPATRGRARDGRLRAALLAADEPARRRPAAAGPRRRRPRSAPAAAATSPRSPATPRPRSAPLMGDRELRVENDRPLPVDGNPDELHRMVLNLLDNAARHTPAGLARSSCDCAPKPARPWSRSPTTAPAYPPSCASRSSTASSAARARPTPRSAPAAASAWRSSAPSPPPTAARVEVGESEPGGALFRARLPLTSLSEELARLRPALAPPHYLPADETQGPPVLPDAPAGPLLAWALDLDDDRQDHRPAAQLLVDEPAIAS